MKEEVLKPRLEVLMSINLGMLTEPQINVLNEIMTEIMTEIMNERNNLEG